MTITTLISSGRVTRWHMNPEMSKCNENNAEHQWKVAMLYASFFPDATYNEIMFALTHDVGEVKAGDLGYDFKIANSVLARSHAELEMKERAEILNSAYVRVEALSEVQYSRLKLCDWLAAWEQMMFVRPAIRGRKDWAKQLGAAIKLADELLVGAHVNDFIQMVSRNALGG